MQEMWLWSQVRERRPDSSSNVAMLPEQRPV